LVSGSVSIDRQGYLAGIPCINRQVYVQRSLMTAKGAEVWYRPIQPDELQQALHKACGLSQWQPEQHFQSETDLDRSIAEVLLPTTLAARWWYPNHLRIKPNRQ